MHVVEHVGLARYGDPLDYDGDLKAIAELRRVVAPGGQLLFVVPMGGEARIQFNAHRIYTYRQVLSMFPGFDLVEFSLIPDEGSPLGLVRHAEEELADQQRYGCGCFWLRKQT
jgi:SAM-dependent methyltransferase